MSIHRGVLLITAIFIWSILKIQAAPLSIVSVDVVHVSCNGGSDGSITVKITGGTAPYRYTWLGGVHTTSDTFYIITNQVANPNFWIFVNGSLPGETDFISGIVLSEPPPLVISNDLISDVTCFGASDGSISVSVAGGNPPYSFSWSGPLFSSGDEDISGLGPGNYILTVTDTKGCTKIHSPVVISEPAALNIVTTSLVNVSCFGAGNGSINITPSGGTTPYSYAWAGPGTFTASTEDISGLAPGNYSLVLTDANGCIQNHGPLTITQPADITINTDAVNHVICNGANNGSILITVSGGTSPYSYVWTGPGSFSATTEDISGLAPGNYSLTLTDSKSCIKNYGPIAITQPAAISVVTSSVTPVSCNGGSNGAIDVTVSGGTPPYAYAWTGPGSFTASTEDISGIVSGNYNLTVTDSKGCTRLHGPVNVSQPTVISVTLTSVTHVLCFGGNNGAVNVTVSGGTPPYAFAWTGPGSFSAGTEDISSLLAGNYNLTVTDGNGCVRNYGPVTVNQPAAITITTSAVNHVTCNGANNGSILITVAGGTIPYSYAWTGPGSFTASTKDISGLAPGDYSLVLTDANGCTRNHGPISITQPPVLTAVVNTITHVSCNGGSNGAITVNTAGGTPAYTYAWSGPGGFTASTKDISGLAAGNYTLTVTDARLCTRILGPVAVTEPAAILVVPASISHVKCFGGSNGIIDITATGGTTPYAFSWTGPGSFTASTEDISGLAAGAYSLVLTDAKGCIHNFGPVNINQPADINITTDATNHVTCNGANDGSILITVAGGTTPYSYAWTGPGSFTSASEDITGLAPGNYSLTLTDVNGCTKNLGPVTITQPAVLTVVTNTVTPVSCNGGNNGAINVTISGGTTPYSFAWTGPGSFSATTEDLSGLLAGNYNLVVTDARGCTRNHGPVTVNQPVALTIPSTVSTNVTGCYGNNDGTITITAAGGTPPYQYSINGGLSYQASGIFTGLTAGNYQVRVRDNNSCTRSGILVTITQPQQIVITSETPVNVQCNGANNGSITITASGGTAPLQYSVDNGSSFQSSNSFPGLSPGTYQVMVRDAALCTVAGSTIIITQPPPLVIVSETYSHVTCNGGNNGSIIVTVSGGVSPYTYSGNGGVSFQANGGNFVNLPANTYNIVVRDQSGCLQNGSSIVLTEPAALQYTIDTVRATCSVNTNDGSILFTGVSGGTGPYTYSVNNGVTFQPNPLFSSLPAGTYLCVLRDSKGCLQPLSVVLEGRDTVNADAGTDLFICPGGQVTLSGSGGDVFQWSPAAGLSSTSIPNPVAAPSVATSYILTTYKGACYDSDTVYVGIYTVPALDAGKDTTYLPGTVVSLVATGGPFASYSWTPVTGLSNPNSAITEANPSGDIIYTIIATTPDGCIAKDSILLTAVREIEIANAFTPNNDGFNDTWKIRHAADYPDIMISVFNRWGELIFHTRGYSSEQEWDGKYKGKDLPMGTYYYVIELNDALGSKPLTGPVTIIR